MFKKSIIAALLVFLLGGTIGAYAWWDRLQDTSNETILIGEGLTLTVSEAVVSTGTTLVPASAVLQPGDVVEKTFAYTVALDFVTVDEMDLSIAESDVQINSLTTNAALVLFTFEWTYDSNPLTQVWTEFSASKPLLVDDIAGLQTVYVRVTVELDEPASEEVYDAIINQNITFTLTFTAAEVVA